jgi:hypothetical protein
MDLCCITIKTQDKQHESAPATVSSQTHDPDIHKLQQSLMTMRTDGHARLKSIKVMVIQNVSGLSARCPATVKELKTTATLSQEDREGSVKPFQVK